MLSPDTLGRFGMFDPAAVDGLVRRCRAGRASGFAENQALVAVLSAQLWYEQFFASRASERPLPPEQADALLGVTGDEAHVGYTGEER
jgi:asparagine synthase (glutamine-hydrolysing)